MTIGVLLIADIPIVVATVLQATEPPPLSTGMLVVFGIIVLALVLFVWEPVPIDVTAIGVMVTLIS